jgi:hypothetical protein
MSEQNLNEAAPSELTDESLEDVAGGSIILLMPPIPIEVVIAVANSVTAE